MFTSPCSSIALNVGVLSRSKDVAPRPGRPRIFEAINYTSKSYCVGVAGQPCSRQGWGVGPAKRSHNRVQTLPSTQSNPKALVQQKWFPLAKELPLLQTNSCLGNYNVIFFEEWCGATVIRAIAFPQSQKHCNHKRNHTPDSRIKILRPTKRLSPPLPIFAC